jgi:hypothetical protein
MRTIIPTPNVENASERTLRAALLATCGLIRRFASSPDATLVVGRTFTGAVLGGVLGAAMLSAFEVPYSWAGLIFGAALGSAFAMGEQPRE